MRTRRRPTRSRGWWRVFHVFVHIGRKRQELISSLSNIRFLLFIIRRWFYTCICLVFTLVRLAGDMGLSVPEPVDVVSIDGFLDNSFKETLSGIQKSGVWHSIERFWVNRTTLAYEVVVADGGGDFALTSPLASPYGRFFSAFTRWISFSWIHTGQFLDDEKWSPLQFTQQIESELHSLPSWPSCPHFQHFGDFLQNFLEWPNSCIRNSAKG